MVKDRFVWGANSNENYSADKRSSFHMNPQNPYAPAAPRTAPRAPAPGARPWVCLVPNPEQRGQGHGWDGMGGVPCTRTKSVYRRHGICLREDGCCPLPGKERAREGDKGGRQSFIVLLPMVSSAARYQGGGQWAEDSLRPQLWPPSQAPTTPSPRRGLGTQRSLGWLECLGGSHDPEHEPPAPWLC